MHRNLYLLLVSLLPLGSLAQQHHQHGTPAKAAPTPAASPAPAAAAVPARSATTRVTGLETYQRFRADEPLTDWRAVNDTVRDIGGWQAYAQEAARAIKAEQEAKAAAEKGRKP